MLRIMLMLRAAAACLVAAAVVILLPFEPALAQDGGGTVALSIAELVLGALGTAFVPVALALWALFKAHAAQSEAKWDDWLVSRIKDVAREVNKEAVPEPLEPIDARGLFGRGNGGAS